MLDALILGVIKRMWECSSLHHDAPIFMQRTNQILLHGVGVEEK